VLSFAPHKRLLWPAGIYFVKDASAGDAADATRAMQPASGTILPTPPAFGASAGSDRGGISRRFSTSEN